MAGQFALIPLNISGGLVIDLSSDRQISFPYQRVTGVDLSYDGLWFGFAYGLSPYIRVLDASTMTDAVTLVGPPTGAANCCAFNHDKSMFAVGLSGLPYLAVHNTSTGIAATITGGAPPSAVAAIAYSPSGNLLAVGCNTSPYLVVYNTGSWAKITLTGGNPPGAVTSVAFSPDGTMLAVTHNSSPYLTVYNTSTWAKVTLTGGNPAGGGAGVSFSPDSTRLACGQSTSPYLVVYNTSTWAKLTLTGVASSGVGPTGFSPDGRYLVHIGNSATYPNVSLWDTATWTKQTDIKALSKTLDAVANTTTAISGVPIFFRATPARYLRGTVRDFSGSPADRVVRIYRRDTGALVGTTVSDATTGDYELKVYDGDIDYDVQFMIETGETLNDLFYARTTTDPT